MQISNRAGTFEGTSYVICLIVLGLPTMIMEFSVGRAAQTSPLYMYRKLSGGRGKWNLWGIVCLIGNIALIAFYAVVSGWILYYFVKFLTGQNQDFGFEKMITTPSVNVTYLLFTLLIAFVILSFHILQCLQCFLPGTGIDYRGILGALLNFGTDNILLSVQIVLQCICLRKAHAAL